MCGPTTTTREDDEGAAPSKKKSVSRRWRQKKSNAATRSVGRSSLKNALGGGEGGGERNLAKSVQEGFLPPSPNGLPDAVAPAEKKGRRDNPIISSAIWEERGWLELGREGGEKILTKRKIVPRRWRKILFFFLYCRVFCSHFHGLFFSDFFLCATHTRKRDDAKVRFSLFLREKKKSPSGVKIRLQLRRWRHSTFFFFFPAGFIKHEREQQRAGIKSHD